MVDLFDFLGLTRHFNVNFPLQFCFVFPLHYLLLSKICILLKPN
jgi:hypothetical protein